MAQPTCWNAAERPTKLPPEGSCDFVILSHVVEQGRSNAMLYSRWCRHHLPISDHPGLKTDTSILLGFNQCVTRQWLLWVCSSEWFLAVGWKVPYNLTVDAIEHIQPNAMWIIHYLKNPSALVVIEKGLSVKAPAFPLYIPPFVIPSCFRWKKVN